MQDSERCQGLVSRRSTVGHPPQHVVDHLAVKLVESWLRSVLIWLHVNAFARAGGLWRRSLVASLRCAPYLRWSSSTLTVALPAAVNVALHAIHDRRVA